MQFHGMLDVQIFKYGDASPAFSTTLIPHQPLTCQTSISLPHKIKPTLAYLPSAVLTA